MNFITQNILSVTRGTVWGRAKEAPEEPHFALTTSDKVLAISNLAQLALAGAAYYGITPSIVLPLSELTGFASEVANYQMLPSDASMFRKLISLPCLSKCLIDYNPCVARAFQFISVAGFLQTSVKKLNCCLDALLFRQNEAIVPTIVRLFNIASSFAIYEGYAKFPKSYMDHAEKAEPPQPNLDLPRNIRTIEKSFAQDACPPKAIANHPCPNCGMFATNLYVVGLLDRFEMGKYSGVKIDFGNDGLYYDAARGPNWFEYYFQPVDVTNSTCSSMAQKTFTNHELGDLSSYAERVYGYERTGVSPERAKALIDKYFVLRPDVQAEIDQFTQKYFSPLDYIFGVHYRGTDKTTQTSANGNLPVEARKVAYGEMTSRIQEQVDLLPTQDQARVKIFAATDEAGFIDHLQAAFPDRVVVSPAKKSIDGKPLHFNAKDPYQAGKEALFDCWMLGKLSKVLIRTSSNLSKFASLMLSPLAKVVEVSKRIHQDPAR